MVLHKQISLVQKAKSKKRRREESWTWLSRQAARLDASMARREHGRTGEKGTEKEERREAG